MRNPPLFHRVLSFVPTYLLVVSLLALAACSGAPPPESGPGSTHASVASGLEAAGEIGLRPGDAVRVEIWREADLSGEFTVNQEGLVVFPLLGERRVRRISPPDLERQLAADYREYLENPSVNVTVLRRLSILGEVRNPGLYPVDATVSITDALALAGGVSPQGNKNDIRLIRDGRVIRQSLDGASVVAASPIQSGDQILVGQRSWLSRNLPLVTAAIGATTSIAVALLLR